MRNKLISHESPLSLLKDSLSYNDYDYILVHLLEQEPEYLDFFESSTLRMGRKSLMDTSIFELGSAFDTDKYATWVDRINPTEYILPDVLEDYEGTIESSRKFQQKFGKLLKGKQIGVVQGKSFEEIKSCYRVLDRELNVDKIAISFDYSYYRTLFPHPNKWVSFMMGRVMLIGMLFEDGLAFNRNKPHHLLGCSNPLEFKFYKHSDFDFIESIDTSSPVVHGLYSKRYSEEIGSWNKVSVKLADLIKACPSEEEKSIIMENIALFRSYVN